LKIENKAGLVNLNEEIILIANVLDPDEEEMIEDQLIFEWSCTSDNFDCLDSNNSILTFQN